MIQNILHSIGFEELYKFVVLVKNAQTNRSEVTKQKGRGGGKTPPHAARSPLTAARPAPAHSIAQIVLYNFCFNQNCELSSRFRDIGDTIFNAFANNHLRAIVGKSNRLPDFGAQVVISCARRRDVFAFF